MRWDASLIRKNELVTNNKIFRDDLHVARWWQQLWWRRLAGVVAVVVAAAVTRV